MAPLSTSPRWVAGVDGCPAGWLVVLHDQTQTEAPQCLIASHFSDIVCLPQEPTVIAVDMPIGLSAHSERGGRRCDVEARKVLGARQSAVFAVPARSAVMQTEYRAACDVALRHSTPPRRVSKQCFNLFGKIREIDALMTPCLQTRIYECHPEAAFWAMNDCQPLTTPKKVKSRPNEPGLAERRRLLEAQGFDAEFLRHLPYPRRQAGADDLLDACACAVTAARIQQDKATRFPTNPPLDARGLRMEIWA